LLTWLLACTWGSSGNLLLPSDSSGSIGVLMFLALHKLSVRNVVPTLTSDKRQGLSLYGRC
jgi:hypothetical protein